MPKRPRTYVNPFRLGKRARRYVPYRPRVRRVRKYTRRTRNRGLRPAVHAFKRTVNQTISFKGLADGTLPVVGQKAPEMLWTADGGMVYAPKLQFNKIPNNAEFTALFGQYKITGAKFTFTPCNSVKDGWPSQIKMMYKWMSDATTFTQFSTNDQWNEIQAKKSRILPMSGKPFSIYVKAKSVGTNVDDNLTPPQQPAEYLERSHFTSMLHPDALHYGIQFRFDCVDTTNPLGNLGAANALFNMQITYYFKCRQVQ